jgi:hypothetical protein
MWANGRFFFEVTPMKFLKTCLSTYVFTFGFNTTVLQHFIIVKCVNGSPQIILEAGLVTNMTLVVSWPARSPDLNPLDFIVCGYLKTKVYTTTVDTREEPWRRIQRLVSEVNNAHASWESL